MDIEAFSPLRWGRDAPDRMASASRLAAEVADYRHGPTSARIEMARAEFVAG